jgi:coenzyme F420-0:L-glutamate ligase/coenzyme F420-1:gamma-L-glutamate ligase
MTAVMTISAFPVKGIKDVRKGDNLADLIQNSLREMNTSLKDRDLIVLASKVISKAEGRIVEASEVEVSKRAKDLAATNEFDPVQVQLALNQAAEVISTKRVLITKTAWGLVCNFSGVDKSNAPEGHYILLPSNPDESARIIREELELATGLNLGVVISDTQGRPWRRGSCNLAIGCSGIGAFKHNAGREDLYGRVLQRSVVCQVDELAALAEPLMGQAGERTPVVIIRGYDFDDDGSRCRNINRSEDEDITRRKE